MSNGKAAEPVQTSQGGQSSPYPPAAQWNAAQTTQIPIDPALQQQSQSATASPYPQYQGFTHYPQFSHYSSYVVPPGTSTNHAQAQQRAGTSTAPPLQSQVTPVSNGIDTADVATLNDALGSAGVDLRAEEDNLQKSYDQNYSYRPYEDRTRKQPSKPYFDTRILAPTMKNIGADHKVNNIPEDSVNYLALALRARLQDLVTAMIAASKHRTDTQFDRDPSFYEDGAGGGGETPMWGVVLKSDVAKQLAALEKVERQEEMKIRRERKEHADAAAAQAAALAAQTSGGGAPGTGNGGGAMAVDEDGEGANPDKPQPKKKRKRDGPGVTARNMSEDVRKKMSNAAASHAAGLGGKYSWMNAANLSTGPPKTKKEIIAGATVIAAPTGSSSPKPASTTPAAVAKPYEKTKAPSTPPLVEEEEKTTVTMRDAVFVIERERGHGGGRGSARGWT